MGFDFEQEYGVNAGYVQALYEEWLTDPDSIDESWQRKFESVAGPPPAKKAVAPPAQVEPVEKPATPASPVLEDDEDTVERLAGIAGRIVTNMTESLEIPVATSVRTLQAKLLDENRRILNEHMQLRALGKASFTHIIAFALVRAFREMPRVQASFEERDGKPHRRVPAHVNIGLAIDLAGPDGGRSLVVASLKKTEAMTFAEFHAAYEDMVARARDGKLGAEDFKDTTFTLTNPGGFGTVMSIPRLMKGQGVIIATGSIGVPPSAAGMSNEMLANLALGKVMTMTSTYDHRVIQGAESGRLLKLVDELLQGEHGFYDEIFESLRIPWSPLRSANDQRESMDAGEAQAKIWKMISAYRTRGCMLADLDPLEYRPEPQPSLDPASYGFTVWDLDRVFLGDALWGTRRKTLREILTVLRRAYCRRWTTEYMHIADHQRKTWIRERIEKPENEIEFTQEERVRILTWLSRAEDFERFLHTRYVGNKRFSLEGAEALIPLLAELIEHAALQGVEKVVIGMAHRGRLNVLANIMGKSYEQVFREFEGVLLPLSTEGSGDVKYHMGQRGHFKMRDGSEIEVVLSANPSHLEAVDPVVCGMTRAWQDSIQDDERKRVLSVLIHGDAAFSGQGVVAETLNMSELDAYSNGGTVHIVVNNQIGFTASPKDLRSTYYCTDIAKGIQAPVVHANADYPESVLRATRVAVDYQRRFGSDSVIDMVCYRRWGHNEGDEPAYTQPVLYSKIKEHVTPKEQYTRLLIRRGALKREEADAILQEFETELQAAVANFSAEEREELPIVEILDLDDDDPADFSDASVRETGVDESRLVDLMDRLNRMPEDLVVHPNLLRQLRRREQMVRGEKNLDWGCAESLAFGSIVEDGTCIRLSGQDSGRGTFSHRHAVIRDQKESWDHVPLAGLRDDATFEAWDSLLSEEAVLGFEYGYSVARSQALVLWEAQFGDFANGAQIQIDQFIASGGAKWQQHGGLVMLLPHGYDGQGPEHSSARPERFLSLCSTGNLVICNPSTAAQYFHLLRRQAADTDKRPLVVFTPKSLLRDKQAASPIADLTSSGFRELIVDESVESASTIVLCSGKVYYDLIEYREKNDANDTAIVRLEQLYPLPRTAILDAIRASGATRVVWCQEEPRNMGAWPYLLQRFSDMGQPIEYSGRPESSSPATGSYRRHVAEQEHLIKRAFGTLTPA